MRKTSMIVGSLFLLAVCTGCGKSDYAVTPENVALYAQGSSENSFFQLFDAAKDQAKVEEADGTTTYTLAEPYTVDGQDGKITIQFANESWSDCYFTFMFEGEDYLKNAYEFMYAYDQKMQKTYGDPDEARGTPFLTWADSYDNFLSQLHTEVPVISANHVTLSDGTFTTASKQKDLLYDYQTLQYYLLFD